MKVFDAVAVILLISAHTIPGGLFDGEWSPVSSPNVSDYGYESISGKDEYIWFQAESGVMRFNIKTFELLNFDYDSFKSDLMQSNISFNDITFFAP